MGHDDIVTAYAHEFEQFEMAAGDISRGCDYLNRLISQTSMGSSGTDRRPTVIDGKYRKQNVQAVKHPPSPPLLFLSLLLMVYY